MKLSKSICLIGPTASGKTGISIELAKYFEAEIINLDSVQIYKGMDIGSAKPSHKELETIIHHLINISSIDNPLSSYDIFKKSFETIKELIKENKNIIITGGTGLYYKNLLYGMFENSSTDIHFRESLKDTPASILFDQLNAIDKKAALRIHPNDVVRIKRALEVFHKTGESILDLQANQDYTPPCDFLLIGILIERSVLYDQINKRVDLMIDLGLIKEVTALYERYPHSRLLKTTIGYKEIISYLNSEISLNNAIEKIKQHSRNFAKRQLTLFRQMNNIEWKEPQSIPALIDYIKAQG